MNIKKRILGKTGEKVFPIGLGTGPLGNPNLLQRQIDSLVSDAIDLGVNLFDTAPSYGQSEERLGISLHSQRKEILLSTKVGYGVEGISDWTYDSIIFGVEKACKRLRTDYLDVVHLHSCPLSTLKNFEVVEALLKTKEQGKIRFTAYSGDNQELQWAVSSGFFDVVQCSANICDRYNQERILPVAKLQGLGVLAKRALANSVWMLKEQPAQNDLAIYYQRFHNLNIDRIEAHELAVRYITHHSLIDCALIGTTQLSHLQKNIELFQKGPLAIDQIRKIEQLTLDALGSGIV